MARKYNDVVFLDIKSGFSIVRVDANKSRTRKKYVLKTATGGVLFEDQNPIIVYEFCLMKIEELEKVDKEIRK